MKKILIFILSLMPAIGFCQEEPAQIQAVDLGLSVKWANMDLGAKSEYGYGEPFAWGETKTKARFRRVNYEFFKPASSVYKTIGKDISGTEYDAARKQLGGTWRMPRQKEWIELVKKCKWTLEREGNSYYIKVTGKTGAYIIIYIGNYRSIIDYWTSTNSTVHDNFDRRAWRISFSLDGKKIKKENSCIGRERGLCIRPVCE